MSKQFTKPRISDVYCKIILLVVVLLGNCDRVCRPALQIRTLFQTKIKDVIFHTQTWPLKFNNPFQTQPYVQIERNQSPLPRLERQQKDLVNIFWEFAIKVLFLSYLFGIEMINTFIHSRSSLENHTRFQISMGQVYTRFQTKKAQILYPMEQHIPIWFKGGTTGSESYRKYSNQRPL